MSSRGATRCCRQPGGEPRPEEEIEVFYLQECGEVGLNRIPAWHLVAGIKNELAELSSVTVSESRLSTVGGARHRQRGSQPTRPRQTRCVPASSLIMDSLSVATA
jgi:hypothetical protein